MRHILIAATLLGAFACGVPDPGEQQTQTQDPQAQQQSAPDDAASTGQTLCSGWTDSYCFTGRCGARPEVYRYACRSEGGTCVCWIADHFCGSTVCG